MTKHPNNDNLNAFPLLQGRNAESKTQAMYGAGIMVAEGSAGLGEVVMKAIGWIDG